MNKSLFFTIFVSILSLFICNSSFGSTPIINLKNSPMDVAYFNPYSTFEYPFMPIFDEKASNGKFNVYLKKQGNWQLVGKLAFDKYFRARSLDLSKFTNGNAIKIRLKKNGGGASHIDSVLLNNKTPFNVKDSKTALKKLSKSDFDVLDATDSFIDLEFTKHDKKAILTILARIEETEISKTPFQYPTDNLFKEINNKATFYNYTLKSANEKNKKLIFKEYSLCGSGHPSGYTYGWVGNDNKNLFVDIDFTPDNTMDGDKDYARVYIKIGEILSEFTIKEKENRWGKAFFTYTDKAMYEHKFYSFKIPFNTLGITPSEINEIKMAFSSYGTAAPAPVCGSSQGQSFQTTPTANLCNPGTPSAVTLNLANNTWEWTCVGQAPANIINKKTQKLQEINSANGVLIVSCWSYYTVNGSCGAANGQLFATAPSNNLCTTGTPSAITGTGPWTWTCNGSGAGTNADCFANLQINNPGDTPIQDDNDGVIPITENNAPNNGDANNDGTQDSTQQNVASFPSSATNSYVTLQTDSGTQIINVITYDQSGIPNPDSGGYEYPLGFFEFEIGLPKGVTQTQITIYFEDESDLTNYIYRKFNETSKTWSTIPGVTVGKIIIDGKWVAFINFTIEDGGPYDADGVVNGKVKDPGGPAVKITTLTVKKQGTGSGVINASGCDLIWSGNTGVCTANASRQITLTAIPDSVSVWDGWSDGTNATTGCPDNKCVFTLIKNSGITGTFNISPNKLILCDIDNNGIYEIVKTEINGSIFYFSELKNWINIPGFITKAISCGDLNNDEKTDIVGINNDDSVSYTFDLGKNWHNIPGSLSTLGLADLNGDDRLDIYGIDNSGMILVTYNLSDWTHIAGSLVDIKHGNFNLSSLGNEFAGLNISGNIYYTMNLSDWINIPGVLSMLSAGDINGDGKTDLLGLTADKEIYHTTDLSTWIKIPGNLSFLTTCNLFGAGSKNIIGYNSSNDLFYTSDLFNWFNIPGKLSNLIAGDLNGDGNDDLAGIGSDGEIYYTIDLLKWVRID